MRTTIPPTVPKQCPLQKYIGRRFGVHLFWDTRGKCNSSWRLTVACALQCPLNIGESFGARRAIRPMQEDGGKVVGIVVATTDRCADEAVIISSITQARTSSVATIGSAVGRTPTRQISVSAGVLMEGFGGLRRPSGKAASTPSTPATAAYPWSNCQTTFSLRAVPRT